jgi:hypothetical protein
MGPGGLLGLQIRCSGSFLSEGGFDSLALPPVQLSRFNGFGGLLWRVFDGVRDRFSTQFSTETRSKLDRRLRIE